jgi:hypothetical protein
MFLDRRIVRISHSRPDKPPRTYEETPIEVKRFDDKEVVINLFKETFLTYGRNELPDEAA